jgi:hypothetical protein
MFALFLGQIVLSLAERLMNEDSELWMVTLAERVKARRVALSISQREVARLAGCHYVFVHDLEKGKPTLRINKVLDVLRVLGLHLVIAE